MRKIEKTIFVQNLIEQLKKATSVVLINYSGISVKMQQDLKARLSVIGAQMSVVKNTLFKVAGSQAKMSNEILTDTVLSGPMAMVITEGDPIAPLSVLQKFAKEHEMPHFKVGIVDGKFQDKSDLERLSTLPSKEILLAQAIGTIASPMYGLVGVLQGSLQKLVYILNVKAQNSNVKSESQN